MYFPIGTRPAMDFVWTFKIHKAITNNTYKFWSILLTINTPV